MFYVTGNSVYLAYKKEVLWPLTKKSLGKIKRL